MWSRDFGSVHNSHALPPLPAATTKRRHAFNSPSPDGSTTRGALLWTRRGFPTKTKRGGRGVKRMASIYAGPFVVGLLNLATNGSNFVPLLSIIYSLRVCSEIYFRECSAVVMHPASAHDKEEGSMRMDLCCPFLDCVYVCVFFSFRIPSVETVKLIHSPLASDPTQLALHISIGKTVIMRSYKRSVKVFRNMFRRKRDDPLEKLFNEQIAQIELYTYVRTTISIYNLPNTNTKNAQRFAPFCGNYYVLLFAVCYCI